jgi:hypothetical protein
MLKEAAIGGSSTRRWLALSSRAPSAGLFVALYVLTQEFVAAVPDVSTELWTGGKRGAYQNRQSLETGFMWAFR